MLMKFELKKGELVILELHVYIHVQFLPGNLCVTNITINIVNKNSEYYLISLKIQPKLIICRKYALDCKTDKSTS